MGSAESLGAMGRTSLRAREKGIGGRVRRKLAQAPEEQVVVELVEETEVYVRVDGFFSERGAYTLSWR